VKGTSRKLTFRRKVVVGAGLLAVVFVAAVMVMVTADERRTHLERPVPAHAVVTDEFINGFGGDPAVDYRYVVRGHRFSGYAVAGDYPGTLHKGQHILIHYETRRPSRSCVCYGGP
jgi:hypothetical protein